MRKRTIIVFYMFGTGDNPDNEIVFRQTPVQNIGRMSDRSGHYEWSVKIQLFALRLEAAVFTVEKRCEYIFAIFKFKRQSA